MSANSGYAAAADIGALPKTVPFQERARRHAEAAVNWLVRSIEACGGKGSAVLYSRLRHPVRGWAPPYPETTGYIIPTLIRYGHLTARPELVTIAIRQADWIMSLQSENGALPGSHISNRRVPPPSIFNTGQMIKGLVAAADETGDPKYLEAGVRAAGWLAREVDASAGIWTRHAYRRDYSPAYYTRVCWPMLEVHNRAPDESIKTAAVRVLDTIVGWQQPNGAVRNWGFDPDRAAVTHTIAYTIRGFLESGRLLGAEGVTFWAAGRKAAEALRTRTELRGRLAGAYDQDLKGQYAFACLTGHCQMALVWMLIYQYEHDMRFLSVALKTLDFVMNRQRMRAGLSRSLYGAVAGSSPFWGRYLTLRYPNWAPKFLVDGLLEADRHLGALAESGPCVSS